MNGTPSTHPQTWFAAADTNQNYLGDFVAQGRFALDDLVVKTPVVTITDTRNPDGSINLLCQGIPGLSHRVWTTTNLAQSFSWQPFSTNLSSADGSWQLVDASATNYPSRFYRASLP